MGVFYLHAEQLLPVDIQTAWAFFSSPNNLALITPPEMDFKTLTSMGEGQEIYTGMLIDYKVKPLFGIRLHWQTEIVKVQKPHSFTDIQVRGPYKLWQHTHTFTPNGNGVLMKDEVKYQLPFGPMGNVAHFLLVRKKLAALFRYRKVAIERIFK
ncbi:MULTISPECIES: SRPBCC family protein [Niastella]|uniref:SRPBCC family protein n=1 Tax=Niastella soli TaxID=2821487 RepID=A0ABS3YN82_9BACT|nr:SRPBCC family protein [Niastella soli]MBO9199349.1 SRPBCC family protein [Niastella soli]